MATDIRIMHRTGATEGLDPREGYDVNNGMRACIEQLEGENAETRERIRLIRESTIIGPDELFRMAAIGTHETPTQYRANNGGQR